MTTTTLAINKVQKNLQAKVDSVSLPVINWKVACFIGIIMVSILSIFYVWQVNSLTQDSYMLNNYQHKIDKLTVENKNLQVSFAEDSFLGQALVKIQALNFQKITSADSVKYVQIPDSSVAIAKTK